METTDSARSARNRDGKLLNALSFDIEDYFHASALAGAFGDTRWDDLPSRVQPNTERLIDLLDEQGIKATFYILGWVAKRYPGLVRKIAGRGHEVACHGYSHQQIFNQPPDVFQSETIRAKQVLEDLAGATVSGYRAASFSITRKSLWALEVLAEAGFTYDSSIFPVVHDRYGLPGAPRFPYRIELASGRSLIEFPPPTLRILGLTIPAGGGGYFRLLPYVYSRLALRFLNQVERKPMMFYLHPWDIDSQQPVGKVGRLTRIRHYFNAAGCEARLRRLLNEAAFSSAADVLKECGKTALPVVRMESFV